MRRSNAPTLQDVAREAGVTAMPVSVVMNGARSATRVSDATRVRIQEAAARLRYRPNAVAQGLSRRRMDTIGVVTKIDLKEINLYFLEVLNGILEAAARHGQNTTVFSVTDWQNDEKRLLQFCDSRVDGIILLAPAQIRPAFVETLHHHIPLVMIHGNSENPNADDLDVDNKGGAYAIVRHLIEQGHRRIAHFAGEQELLGARHRLIGYRSALEESGIGYDESLVIACNFSAESGREGMTRLLTEGKIDPLPTAIFCANDTIASGALEVLVAHGIRVPDDISVTGFDDMLLARMTTPPLTTVHQPLRGMGQFSVERLLFRISEEVSAREAGETSPNSTHIAPPSTEIFPVEVVLRASSGLPARAIAAQPD